MRTKLFILSLAILLALSACAPSAANESTLDVTGSGTVYVTPDIAYIYIGVHTENPEIAQAVANNNDQTQAVVNALRNSGVEGKDIQTSNFSVWSYQTTDPLTGMATGTNYSVDNTVYVTVRELSILPDLLDTAIDAGANNINSISFDVADKSTAMTDARQLAMENAAELADELARTAGLSLGGIQNITYSDVSTSYYGYGMGGGGGAEGAVSTPINPGQVQLTATVNVIYGLK
jgi:hypothetical protein